MATTIRPIPGRGTLALALSGATSKRTHAAEFYARTYTQRELARGELHEDDVEFAYLDRLAYFLTDAGWQTIPPGRLQLGVIEVME